MSEYLAPGVFVEEISFQPSQIQPASTSVAGMVGPSRFGPAGGTPLLLSSFNDFLTYFGDASDLVFQTGANPATTVSRTNLSAYAAQMFFDNGGKQLYFARVYNNVAGAPGATFPSPQTASLAIPNPKSTSTAPLPAFATFIALYPGSGGNVDLVFQPRRSAPLLQLGPLLPPANPAPSAGTYVLRVVNANLTPAALQGAANLSPQTTTIQSLTGVVNFTPGATSYTFAPGLAVLVGDQNGLVYPVSAASPPASPPPAGGSPPAQPPSLIVAASAIAASATVTLQTVSTPAASVTAPFGANPVYSIPVGPTLRGVLSLPPAVSTLYATATAAAGTFLPTAALNPGWPNPPAALPLAALALGGAVGDGNLCHDIYDISVQNPNTSATIFSFTGVYLEPDAPKNTLGTAMQAPDPNLGPTTQPVIATVGAKGSYAMADLWGGLLAAFATALLAPPTKPGVAPSFVLHLKTGTDGAYPEPVDFSGEDAPTFGLAALEGIDQVSIVICPAASAAGIANHQEVVAAMVAHCEKMLYRIAVVDSPRGASLSAVQTFAGQFADTRLALYYPWVYVASLGPNGGQVLLPPSGLIAGLYANTDITRGVHKAPANVVLQDAVGLETYVNTSQQEILNPLGINCLRKFTPGGYKVWGARTLSSDPQWQYVNVRRYFMYLEHSIANSTSWVVFEPNGQALWSAVQTTVSDFLYNEWREGHLLGATPAQAFFVRCDGTTMTQADLANGRLICVIGAAPLDPAEFVIFRIGQYTLPSSNS